MKKSTVAGFTLAVSMLSMEKEDSELSKELKQIDTITSGIVQKFANKNYDIKKLTIKAWDFMQESNGNVEVDLITFVLYLLFNNPQINKYKKLKKLCFDEMRTVRWSKVENVKLAKECVYKFYKEYK